MKYCVVLKSFLNNDLLHCPPMSTLGSNILAQPTRNWFFFYTLLIFLLYINIIIKLKLIIGLGINK